MLILLTDGQDTASTVQPLDAAQLAASLGIRIYTIGIGADELTFPACSVPASAVARSILRRSSMKRDCNRLPVSLAGSTSGRAIHRTWSTSIELLDELEPVEQETTTYRPRQALGYLPLLAALAVSFLLALRQSGFTRMAAQRGYPHSAGGAVMELHLMRPEWLWSLVPATYCWPCCGGSWGAAAAGTP